MKRPVASFGRAGEPDPYTLIEKPLSNAALNELCELTGVASSEVRAELKQEVEYWLAKYDRWIRQEAVTVSESKQRKMLESARKAARTLQGAMYTALDQPESYSHLMNAYVSHRDLPTDSSTASYHDLARVDLKHIHRLERALETALSRWPIPRGPKKRTSGYLLAQQMCWIFERYSGKKATHNPYRLSAYVGRPESPAGKFVIVACRQLAPFITATQLSTALSYLVRKGPKK